MGNVNLSGYHLTFDTEMSWATDSVYFINHYYNGDRTIPSNHELEYYVDNDPSNVNNPYTYQNNELTITASPVPAGGLPYTSGMLNTAADFSQNQGYFEIRAQITGTSGFWPAFWLYANNGAEIDMLEQPNTDGPDNYFISTKSNTGDTGGFVATGVNVSAGYHTYGVMWTATAIEFTFDGSYIGYWTATPAQLQTAKMYLIANLAVGGWPPPPAAGTSGSYNIDYIRAYSTDPTIPYWWSMDPVSSPDGANTAPYTLPVLPTVGSGNDQLVIQLSEDAYRDPALPGALGLAEDAQFSVSVDGVPISGTMTASASHVFQQTQSLVIRGNFAAGSHTVAVTFLNDLYEPGIGDRNLYVNQAMLDGNAIAYSTMNLLGNGPQSFGFQVTDPFRPATVVGTGPDVLSLQINEDAYLGDAQFVILVDGQQIGGTQTASVLKSSGSTQAFDVMSSFGGGKHTASLYFLNDAYGGSPSADRNLYVSQASIDNVAIPSSSLALLSTGVQSFAFQSGYAGVDTIVLGVSEDAWLGDAQYTVSIDNVSTGVVYTAVASHALGKVNMQTISGPFGGGAHKIGITFINDAYGGSPTTDRNLYFNSASYDGVAVQMNTISLLSTGNTGTVTTAATAVVSPKLLTLYMAEDAFQGDAQFSVTIDGAPVGATQTVTAPNSTGASQAFSFADVLAAGSHDVGITYLNDLTAPNAIVAGDRNLYLVGADLGGIAQSTTIWNAAFPTNSTQHFNLVTQ